MTNVQKCEINVTVGNVQKIKFKIKGSVNIKLQYRQKLKLTEVLYVSQSAKNLLGVSRLGSEGATMRATQEKNIIKKMALV